jgi:transposase
MEKTDARRLGIEALNERRRRAVKLRLSGMKLDDVAAQAELSKGTIIAAVKAYRAGGWSAVKVGERGRSTGDGRTLDAEQEAALRRLICDKTPEQLKMGFALWSRGAVAQLIEQQYGIRMPVRSVGHYLKRWGFTPQKPIKKAYEQRPAEVKAWLEDEYPAIAERAKEEGAEIHWGDETGLRSDDVRGRGYAPKGQTPVIRVCSKRENLSLISTVTNQGKVRWMVFDGALNAATLIGFFKRLIKEAQRKLFLILDNLKVHHAKVVRQWLAEHTAQIEVFYLPSYSPELNPDECLNADLKQAVTTRAPARAKGQLKKAAISHMHKLAKSPERVRRYFQHDPVRYAA